MSSLPELLPYRGAATERLLLREFSHRVKDELASAISLVAAAAGRCDSGEARAVLVAVLDRLQSHALVHRSLQMPEYDTTVDVAAYLQQLCRAISRAELAGAGIELLLSVHPLRINADRCWLLGMIVFELIADAARHSFPVGARSIRLEVWPAGSSIGCCISDDGMIDEGPLHGKGLAIIEALVTNLQGTVESRSGPGGNRCVVKIPID
jgi:two-component sensor histidine kinase